MIAETKKLCKHCNEIEVKKFDICKTCSIKQTYARKRKNKIAKIISENEQITDARLSKTSNHNIEVDFTCGSCGNKTTKLYSYFLKNKECKSCSYSKASKKRNEKKYGKNIDKMETYLHENNIEYFSIEEKKDHIYSDIEVLCNNCGTKYKSEFYRIQRFYDRNAEILCKECKKQESKYKHGCSVTFYSKNKIGEELGYFYSYDTIVEGKKCYKIGITRQDVLGRVKDQVNNPRNIVYIKMTNLECAKLERELKIKYKKYNSLLKEKFDGYTEFFDVDIINKENLKVQRLSPKGEYNAS